MSLFQILFTAVFAALILIGVAVFAIFGGAFGGTGVGSVVIWGTTDQETMSYLVESLRSQDKAFEDVTYVQKTPQSYYSDLLNGMASGSGPDLFLVSESELGTFADKVAPVPYSAVSQSAFVNSFIDEGQLLLTPQGALALPFLVDPLVMYWNRDLLGSASIAQPPAYWSELIEIAPKITGFDGSSSIRRSAVALGQWSNVANAKAILSALFIQAGDPVMVPCTANCTQGPYDLVFGRTPAGESSPPAESALRFYTEFSNPGKTTYSWNRSLQNSTDAFVAGQLAIYFGFASEYRSLQERNPNLHFGVASLPQLTGGGPRVTYGKLTGLAISLGSRNPQGALTIAQKLTSATASTILVGKTGLPPARRDIVVDTSANAVAATFVQSALISRGWVESDAAKTDEVFKAMIESVVSGGALPAQAVGQAAQGLSQLLPARQMQ